MRSTSPASFAPVARGMADMPSTFASATPAGFSTVFSSSFAVSAVQPVWWLAEATWSGKSLLGDSRTYKKSSSRDKSLASRSGDPGQDHNLIGDRHPLGDESSIRVLVFFGRAIACKVCARQGDVFCDGVSQEFADCSAQEFGFR